MDAFLRFFIPCCALVTGAFVGSFLNVVIYRLPLMMLASVAENEESVEKVNLWWPPSHCPQCKTAIKPWDNIPVLSWLCLRGKCRSCQEPIPCFYPLSEALMGGVFVCLTLIYFPQHQWSFIAMMTLCVCLLYALAMIDLKTCLLPDSLVYLLLWSGLLGAVLGVLPVSPRDAVVGAVISWALTAGMASMYQWLMKKEGFGAGDIKFFAAAAAWVGYKQVPALLFFSALLGGGAYLFNWFYYCKIIGQNKPLFQAEGGYMPFGPAISVTMAALLLVM